MQLNASTSIASRVAMPRARVQARGRVTVGPVRAAAIPSQYKTVKPVGDRVLVKVEKEETTTSSGILLPSSSVGKPTAGKVVAVGDGWNARAGKSVQMDVKEGDRVMYSKYAGTELDVAGEPHLILKVDDIIGSLAGDDVSKLKPFGDRLLIEKTAAATKTSGGILLPEAAKEAPVTGKVVAVGPGRTEEDGTVKKPEVEVSSTVLYNKYSGVDLQGKDAEYIVVREDDVLVALS